MKNETKQISKRTFIITLVSLSIVAVTFMVLYIVNMNSLVRVSRNLEYSYERSYYDLVDNINNAEIKMSKILVSNDKVYTQKLLEEVVDNTSNASENLSNLPISINGLSDTTKFINKVNGYTTMLSRKLSKETTITKEEKTMLNNIYKAIKEVKANLNKFSSKLYSGYSILDNSLKIDGDYNNLTNGIKESGNDIEYPTMIYDGPFADSVISKEVKGLQGKEITKEEAKNKILSIFDNLLKDKVMFQSETKGRFTTYDFTAETKDKQSLFIQLTKKGGNLLTLSSFSPNLTRNINLAKAEDLAIKFCKKNGLDLKVVWSNIYSGSAYVNLAATEKNVILYPDLVKMKIDLKDGKILGYDASTYFTNHTKRTIPTALIDALTAKEKIDKSFTIDFERLTLIPLEWNKELLCYEFKCRKDRSVYYVYINALNGQEENILKVIETESGNQLL